MRRQGTASVVFALASAVMAVAQTPSARDDAMPLLRDGSRVALRNVRIVDGTGAPARQNQTLIIDNGRIRALGGVTEIVIPEGTQTLDLDGRTLLPGFVMLHEHMFYASVNDNTHPQPFTSPRLFLAFGLTTIRTAGTDHPYVELNLKRSVDAGQVPGPEIHLTSPFMNGAMSGFIGDKIRWRRFAWRPSPGRPSFEYKIAPAASPWIKKPICKSSAVLPITISAILTTSRSSSRTESRTTRQSCCPESKGW
jgi:hypothetical protein